MKGFTLMELILGIGLTGILLATMNVLLVSSLSGARKASAINMGKSEGAHAISEMAKLVRYAESIVCTSTSLVVNDLDGEFATFSLTGNRIASASSAFPAGPDVMVTSDNVRVLGCSEMFKCAAGNKAVNICFKIYPTTMTDVTDSDSTDFNVEIAIRNFGN